GGRPILDFSLEAFSRAQAIDDIIIVVADDHRQRVADIVAERAYGKVSALVTGGVKRFDSTHAALTHLAGKDGHVLVHDAARPFLQQETISGCVEALQTFDAVATVVDSPDTIVMLDESRVSIERTLDRDSLRRLQTPQAFRLGVLAKAVDLARRDPELKSTDDFTLVQHYLPEASTTFIDGDARTFKVTTPEDLIIAEAFLAAGL
ncbi:MAG: 2-C-methyl-D-erythritol 4-phosphate cytidylyltransferase, partial [Aeromicrobium sp.]